MVFIFSTPLSRAARSNAPNNSSSILRIAIGVVPQTFSKTDDIAKRTLTLVASAICTSRFSGLDSSQHIEQQLIILRCLLVDGQTLLMQTVRHMIELLGQRPYLVVGGLFQRLNNLPCTDL